jgi:hypothetical protein
VYCAPLLFRNTVKLSWVQAVGVRKLIQGLLALGIVVGTFSSVPAYCSPWAEVGDAQLRSDLNLLAASGLIDDITTEWPLPWAGLLDQLRDESVLASQPAYVRAAAKRVLAKASKGLETNGITFSQSLDVTNLPSLVYGFDGLGRQVAETQSSGEFVSGSTAGRLSIGARTGETGDHQVLNLDNSYVGQRIGNAIVYGGYVTHWWGPGWISALQLSNNARPFPQIGISRLDTSAFTTPWLSWIGPWQAEFFVGLLDGPRTARNTIYTGLRFTFNPVPAFEVGISRTDEMCGSQHPCSPLTEYFNLQNNDTNPDKANDELQLDFRYTKIVHGIPFEVYTSVMNEDGPNPIIHSVSSHQGGASVWIPFQESNARITVEYTDSVPTTDIFGGGLVYGAAYNDNKYTDGMRYRGRTLGFSLDSDSRLSSLQASIVNAYGVTWTLTYDHANVSDSENRQTNVVTTKPLLINLGEIKVSVPMNSLTVNVAARLQDDQPRPKSGFAAATELSLNMRL